MGRHGDAVTRRRGEGGPILLRHRVSASPCLRVSASPCLPVPASPISPSPLHRVRRQVYYRAQMTQPKIVILGGGFGGLFTALDVAGSADVTLVSDEDHFLFTPMLYEYLSGEVEAWHIAPKYNELLDENVRCIQNACDRQSTSTSQTVSLENSSEKSELRHFGSGRRAASQTMPGSKALKSSRYLSASSPTRTICARGWSRRSTGSLPTCRPRTFVVK